MAPVATSTRRTSPGRWASRSTPTAPTIGRTSQSGRDCKCGGGGVQAIGQEAWNKQDAEADADAFQLKPSNVNAPVSIGGGRDNKKKKCGCNDKGRSDGSGGDVTQTNLAGALGIALNANRTDQSAEQSQSGRDCKCGGGDQVNGHRPTAWNKQDADADADAFQLWAANDNSPVRIGSSGSAGSVRQTDAAL